MFKLAIYRKIVGSVDPEEELLEDPHNEMFVNIAKATKISAIFRFGDPLKVVYKQYIKKLHDMQSMDLEMPADERPTTLKKLIKRHFTNLDEPFRQSKQCSGCQKTL